MPAILSKDWRGRLRYEPSSGSLVWVKSLSTRVGEVAGVKQSYPNGSPKCIKITMGDKCLKAHRIIWEMHHGPIPEEMQVDHVDGNPWNNRLDNLRLVSAAGNARNKSGHSKQGLPKGVGYNKRPGKSSVYFAAIMVDRKRIYLGTHPTPEAAHDAYAIAATKYHGEYATTRTKKK